MQEEAEASQVFTPEMIDTMARIWTRSIITLNRCTLSEYSVRIPFGAV